jgi:hypothetical protein
LTVSISSDLSGDRTFLEGGGRIGALMRVHDWSTSPLGAPETWPQSLRAIVALLLHSKFPMFVAWGKELGFLYNDPYAEILGEASACARRPLSRRLAGNLARHQPAHRCRLDGRPIITKTCRW